MTDPLPHLAIVCPCGVSVASDSPLTPEQETLAKYDVLVVFLMLPEREQHAFSEFFARHVRHMGIVPHSCVIGIAPIQKG